jgi:hypothetical protein
MLTLMRRRYLQSDAISTSPVGRVVPKDDATVYEPASKPARDGSATVVESAAMASSV